MQKRMYMGKELYNPFGTLESETVLWTNPNPTSSSGFVAQDVTLSDDINNYDEIVVEYGYNNSTELQTGVYVYRDIWSVDIFKRNTYNTSDTRNVASFGIINSVNSYYVRAVNYITNTTVRFTSCYTLGGTGTINQDAIPLKIIGVKKGWQPVYGGMTIGLPDVEYKNDNMANQATASIAVTKTPRFVTFNIASANSSYVGYYMACIYDVMNDTGVVYGYYNDGGITTHINEWTARANYITSVTDSAVSIKNAWGLAGRVSVGIYY